MYLRNTHDFRLREGASLRSASFGGQAEGDRGDPFYYNADSYGLPRSLRELAKTVVIYTIQAIDYITPSNMEQHQS